MALPRRSYRKNAARWSTGRNSRALQATGLVLSWMSVSRWTHDLEGVGCHRLQ